MSGRSSCRENRSRPAALRREQKPEQKQESKQKRSRNRNGQPGKPEQKQESEQKQEAKTTPAPEKQSPLQPLRPQSTNQGDQDRIKEFTDLVSLPVTVTDAYNRLVTGLDRNHFEIFEDKVKQEIAFFSDDDAPVNLGIVFDVSGEHEGKLDRARDALKAFIQTSHSDDDFFLVGFNQRANLLAEFTDGDALANKLTLVDPKGQTALYDAAYLGIEKVKQGRHNRNAILLISDGQDNSSRYTYGELRKLLKEAGVQIYCIGIVELAGGAGGTLDMQGQAILEEIAQTTGGKAFFPRSSARWKTPRPASRSNSGINTASATTRPT